MNPEINHKTVMDHSVSHKTVTFPGAGLPAWLTDPMDLARMLDLPPMVPRFPWIGGDLQTFRNAVMPKADFGREGAKRLSLSIGEGDFLSVLHVPGRDARAGIVLLHGLGGDENGAYMKSAARTFQEEGHDLYLVNLRGAGPSARTSRGIYNAGRSRDVIGALHEIAGHSSLPLFGYGISLGGSLLAKAAGEAGDSLPLKAAIAVSSPLDLQATSERMLAWRNRIYQVYLTRKLKGLLSVAQVDWQKLDRRAAQRIRTVYDFDKHVICPLFGYDNPEAYYADASCGPVLSGTGIPLILVQAADDPWLPLDQGALAGIRTNPCVSLLLSPAGGHVGFHGTGSHIPWHERVAIRLIRHFL